MQVRHMAFRDIHHVKECNRRNLPENYHLILLMYMLVMYPESCFVAENNRGEIIGYAMSKLKDNMESDEKTETDANSGYVLSLAVDKAYRKVGLGRILLAASLHGVCRMMGSENAPFKVYLNVRPSNHSAISMYRSVFGFFEESEVPNYYSNGESSLLMCRVFNSHESKRAPEGEPANKVH
ncbi:N-alpha-acetyltransferase 10/11 [Nematocida major]|uniref:N-alpha-acetyltransferase 10/11 n=1 Tax=Nematocida major TaxID=1912982 RepID=UPI0020085606|nr:N-alpha-acetyltransferase 10/11 [Nematocida major]KAH9385496.1 N-alpha-acetyltransferase 10/11 [Nematocida major]